MQLLKLSGPASRSLAMRRCCRSACMRPAAAPSSSAWLLHAWCLLPWRHACTTSAAACTRLRFKALGPQGRSDPGPPGQHGIILVSQQLQAFHTQLAHTPAVRAVAAGRLVVQVSAPEPLSDTPDLDAVAAMRCNVCVGIHRRWSRCTLCRMPFCMWLMMYWFWPWMPCLCRLVMPTSKKAS